jgi:hypothetical protein
VNSATSITATAPTGVTTGPITVTTSGGTAVSTGIFTVPALTIAVSGGNSINEGDSSRTATVTATPAPTSDLTVTLTSSSAGDLTVDGGAGAGATATATISANNTEALFFLVAPADNTIDADASVTLTAAASGYNSGTAAVTVRNVDIAPISITATGTAYTQNFDSLGTTTVASAFVSTPQVQTALGSVVNTNLTGWFGTKLSGNGSSNTGLTADDGNGISGGLYSYGVTNLPANADRALGALASDSNTMGFGAVFKNDTGVTIKSFTLAFSAENWKGATADSKLTFGYGRLGGEIIGGNFLSATGTGVTALASADITGDEQTNTALNGNTVRKSVNVTLTLSVAPGESLFLRWQDFNEVGNDAALAIDDFSLTANEAVVITAPGLTGVTVDMPSLTPTQVTVSSEVVTDGGTNVTGQGFVFTPTATSADPTLSTAGALSVTNDPAVGRFTNNLTNLTAGTAYTVKSYAINGVGTNYSSPRAITTLAAYPTFTGLYTQNFADVTNGTLIPAGWRALSSSNVNGYQGNWTNTNATTGGFYGRAGSPGILGYLHTGSTGILTNKLTLVNGTGGTLTSLLVSYTGEVNKLNPTNNLRFPAFTVAVGNNTNVGSLAYSTAGGTNASVSAEVTGLSIGTNELIVITWASERGTGSGASRMIGLTDVRVSSAPSNLSYSPATISGTVGTAISNLTPTVTGTVTSYAISPALPAGLTISASTGVISGTPSAVTASATYTVTAANAGGSTTTTVTVVVAKGTPAITLAPTASAITAGQALSNSIISGGTVTPSGGTWVWSNPANTNTVVGTNSYAAVYTPASGDQVNWNSLTSNLTVVVNAAGSTFAGWSGGAELNSANVGKYAIGGATNSSAASEQPVAGVDSNVLSLTAIVRTNDAKLAVVGEAGGSLTNWSSNGVSVTASTNTNGVPDGCQRQVFSVERTNSPSRQFLRLKATLAP